MTGKVQQELPSDCQTNLNTFLLEHLPPGEAPMLRVLGRVPRMVDGGGQVLDLNLWKVMGWELLPLCVPHGYSPLLPSLLMYITPCWGVRATGMCKERCGKFHVLTGSCLYEI